MSKSIPKDPSTKRGSSRKYSSSTIKVLFGTCMNECAHPDCLQTIIEPRTEYSDAAIIGQIAHIYAASDDGPRGNSSLSEDERNSPDNLILLCPNHHRVVDSQHETYPAEMLFGWKNRHVRKFQDALGAPMSDLGYEQLEAAARSLMTIEPVASGGGLVNIPPPEKIAKNGLGKEAQALLKMGAANSAEVEDVILKSAQLDAEFPDKLREGFVSRYYAFVADGLKGDELFMAMYEWSGGVSRDRIRQAAGLCVLAHLFIICDVFEK